MEIDLSEEVVSTVPYPKKFGSKSGSTKAAVGRTAKRGCCYCGKVQSQSSHSHNSKAT
jgi:hypothetical protein